MIIASSISTLQAEQQGFSGKAMSPSSGMIAPGVSGCVLGTVGQTSNVGYTTQCSDLDKRSLELIALDEGFRGALQGTLGSPPQALARCCRGCMVASGMMEPDDR
jgi:hypothetical protein